MDIGSLWIPVFSYSWLLSQVPSWYSSVLFKLLPFVIVLGLLIFVHEVGHFLAAKLFRVKVERFSFGLGPRLVGVKVGETDYRISAIPLGGYVKMTGEGLEEEVPPEEQHRSFTHKAVWQRMVIVFSGPLFNVLFALWVFIFGFLLVGQAVVTSEIGEVRPGYPAEQAGLRSGDKILEIDGKPIAGWKELPEIIRKSAGKRLSVVFSRDGKRYVTSVTPVSSTVKNIFGEAVQEAVIGITPSGKFYIQKLGWAGAVRSGLVQTWGIAKLTVVSLIKLVERKLPLTTLGGPIFIAQLAGEQAQEGWVNLLFFSALLSINLAILNLLPIPILDGGHLVFFIIEAVLGKPLSLKKREIAQQVGMVILVMLMVFVFYNDILRLLR